MKHQNWRATTAISGLEAAWVLGVRQPPNPKGHRHSRAVGNPGIARFTTVHKLEFPPARE